MIWTPKICVFNRTARRATHIISTLDILHKPCHLMWRWCELTNEIMRFGPVWLVSCMSMREDNNPQRSSKPTLPLPSVKFSLIDAPESWKIVHFGFAPLNKDAVVICTMLYFMHNGIDRTFIGISIMSQTFYILFWFEERKRLIKQQFHLTLTKNKTFKSLLWPTDKV